MPVFLQYENYVLWLRNAICLHPSQSPNRFGCNFSFEIISEKLTAGYVFDGYQCTTHSIYTYFYGYTVI